MPSCVTLGGVRLAILWDSGLSLEGDTVFYGVPREEWAALRAPDAPGMLWSDVVGVLISAGETHTLVDTGFGEEGLPGQPGKLLESLAALKLAPKDITRVVFTHAHGDHFMGNTLRRGGLWLPTFPRAEHIIQAVELETLHNRNEEVWATRFGPLDQRGLLRVVEGMTELDEVISCWPTPGHSLGHQAVHVATSEGEALVIGDLALYADCFRRPEWAPQWVASRNDDIRTRQRIGRWASETGSLLVVPHDARTPWIRLTAEGDGFMPHPVPAEEM